MRLVITFLAAASLAGCGSPQGNSTVAAEDAAVTVELPPEPPPAPQRAAPEPPSEPMEEAPPETPKAEEPPAAPEPARTAPPPAPKAEEPPAPAESAAPPSPPQEPAAPAARPPLGDAQIARTIDRIGYRCGSVVSASAADRNAAGQPVYRIACSSGEIYRGTNRGGRMFFRPWDARTSGR